MWELIQYLKTSAHDVSTVNVSNAITYGLGGNDKFTADGLGVFNVLVGGWGDDTYVAGKGITIIADHGGGTDLLNLDAVLVDGDGLIAAQLDGGKHFAILNTTTNAAIIIANWRDASYKVDFLESYGQKFSIESYYQIADNSPEGLPMMTWSQLAALDGGSFAALTQARFDQMFELINQTDLAATLQAEAQGVGRLYEAGLNRMADIGGLNYWYDVYMEIGRDKTALSKAFIDSAEFEASFGNPYTQSAESYINVLYQNVLGRPSDAAGAFYWTEQLKKGLSREDALLSFADSAENMAQSPYLVDIVDAGGGNWAFS